MRILSGGGDTTMQHRQYRASDDGCYHSLFCSDTGLTVRWGKTAADDAVWCPIGPEIADIEISAGDCSGKCPWCYKANGVSAGVHMTPDTFASVLRAMPYSLMQVALGITDADKHPDFVRMLEVARERGVVPNYTTAGYGLTKRILDASAELCGAVAVSMYPHNLAVARSTIAMLLQYGVPTNVHLLYHRDNLPFCTSVIAELSQEQFSGLNAVVLLALKERGRATGMGLRTASGDAFAALVSEARGAGLTIGFDSCSGAHYAAYARQHGLEDTLIYSDCCEASLFSLYVDVHGNVWPCSFAEGVAEYEPAPNILTAPFADIWTGETLTRFRTKLLGSTDVHGCRHCPIYNMQGE